MEERVSFIKKYWLLICFFLCIVSLSLGGVGTAFAQDEDQDAEEFTLEEIVVTAEKREAELQRIPMDISVVREQEMRLYNVNQINDLQKIMPDLTVTNTVGTFNLISIREVQTILFNPIYETTVATHLDGIQLNRFAGLDNMFFDLERVEVLKGPQGTLYGRGSTAGSMNILTRKPILGEFSGNGSIEAGNYGRYRADWAFNIPMGDKLGVRISGRRNVSDGYSDSGYGDADSWSHRASFLWEPNDRATFRMMADYEESDDNGFSMFGDEGYYFDTYGNVTIVANTYEDNPTNPAYQSGGPVRARFKSKWALGDMLDDNIADSEHYGVMAQFDYDFDFATMTVEYGHRAMHEYKEFMWGGAYMNPAPFQILQMPWGPWAQVTATVPYTEVTVRVRDPMLFMVTNNAGNTNTIEARLTSNTTIARGDKLEWIVGAMGQRDRTMEQMETVIDAKKTDPVTGNFWFRVTETTDTTGLFAQASWMPVPKWNFTAGVRQNDDEKTYYGNYMQSPRTTYVTVKKDWSELTYRANISYIATNDIMPYISYAKGYRTGNITYDRAIVPPELLDDYEIGLKSRWLDNKLQVNAGYYYYDYQNYSDWAFINACYEDDDGDHYCDDVGSADNPYDPATGVRNPDGTIDANDYKYNTYVGYSPGGAKQQGVALSVQYMPTMNDNIFVNASWSNNKYKKGYNKFTALLATYPDADSPYRDMVSYDFGGQEFGGAPTRGNASYTHTFRFGAFDTLMATLGVFYEGKGIDITVNQGSSGVEYKMPGRDAYMTADFSLMYSSNRWLGAGNMWSLRASVNNMFDNDDLYSINYTDDANFVNNVFEPGSGLITGRYINPRTYSVTFSINF